MSEGREKSEDEEQEAGGMEEGMPAAKEEASVDENQVELLSNIHSAEGVGTSLRESAYQQYMSSYYQWYASIREKEMKDQEAALARSRIPKTTQGTPAQQEAQQQQENENSPSE